MAELALSALASFGAADATATGGAAAIAGATAGGAATGEAATGGLLSFLGAGSTALSVLSGTSTAVSVLQKLNAGQMQSQQADFKAQEASNAAIGEQASGALRVTALKRSLMKTLGENDTAYAASGIDLSYGVAADNRSTQRGYAYDEISTDQATTSARMAGYDASAAAYARMSRAYRGGSLLDVLATTGLGVANLERRGIA